MDQLLKDAQRLVSIGTFFIVAGWVFVIYAIVAGVIWWIDLAQRAGLQLVRGASPCRPAPSALPIFARLRDRRVRLLPAPVRAVRRQPPRVAAAA